MNGTEQQAVTIQALFFLHVQGIWSMISIWVCTNYIYIKTFDFSTLYTTIPHKLLKSRIKELIQRCFSKKNGEQRYQYLVIGRDKSYIVKSHSKSNNKYIQEEIIQMLSFLIDNIFVLFCARMFHQMICIPMGTKCSVTRRFVYMRLWSRLPSMASQE
jgi:hypothetical protein